MIYLASDQSVGVNDWLGLGTSASQFERSNVVIPADATITGIALSIRNNTLGEGETVTATVFTSPCGFEAPVSTGVSVTITGPSDETTPNCCAVAAGDADVPACSLLSVQITSSTNSALQNGAAATVLLNG